MAIILLQTHEQIPGYCTNTSWWGARARRQIRRAYVCRHAAQTRTACLCTEHIFAHSYWESGRLIQPRVIQALYICIFPSLNCAAALTNARVLLIFMAIINNIFCTYRQKPLSQMFDELKEKNAALCQPVNVREAPSVNSKASTRVTHHACAPIRCREIYPKT